MTKFRRFGLIRDFVEHDNRAGEVPILGIHNECWGWWTDWQWRLHLVREVLNL